MADNVSPPDITQLLLDWNHGDQEALNRLMPLVYDELRRIARRVAACQGYDKHRTLQPTALVHEAVARMIDESRIEWKNRAHFYGIVGCAIRRIVVDEFRKQGADKRGGDRTRVSLTGAEPSFQVPELDLLALDQVLEKLSRLDERKVRVIELRFFSGLTQPEIAEVLGISEKTVEREWRDAKAWLHLEMTRLLV